MDLSEEDPIVLEQVIQTAEQWCKQSLSQSWVDIREVAEVGIAYPSGVWGFRIVAVMPDYPHGTLFEVLVAPDGSMSARHILTRDIP
jgi:hypothetical protein